MWGGGRLSETQDEITGLLMWSLVIGEKPSLLQGIPETMGTVVFVTGRGGAGFHSQGPALTRGRGGYFSGNPRPAPARGPPALIPWTGPHLLPPIFNGDPSGVWVGRGPERGQGQGMPKKTPRPRPLSGAGRGKGPGARVFRDPVRPVTNSRELKGRGADVAVRCQLRRTW